MTIPEWMIICLAVPGAALIEEITPDEVLTIRAVSWEGEERVVFKGIVGKACLSVEDGIRYLEIWASSHTCLLDLERHTRIFQNTDRSFAEMAKYIGKENQARVICTEGRGNPTGRLLVQYRETDWEFLKRLASMLHTVVVADSINGRPSFSLGPPSPDREELHGHSIQTVRDLKEYHMQRNSGRKDCQEWDTVSYLVESREVMDICTPVELLGREHYVKRMECHLKGQELIVDYECVPAGGFKTSKVLHEGICGVSLEGAVSKVERDRVQIGFPQDVDQPSVWFPYATAYSSPDGTGGTACRKPGMR